MFGLLCVRELYYHCCSGNWSERVCLLISGYLIWNECRAHSLLLTETGVNMRAKWTCLWTTLLTGLISFVSNPLDNESRVYFATRARLIMVCVCSVYSIPIWDCHGDWVQWIKELSFVKISFCVKAQAINYNITANEAHLKWACTLGFNQKSSGRSLTTVAICFSTAKGTHYNDFCDEDILHIPMLTTEALIRKK